MSATARRTLYPDIEPFDSGFLQVSPLHKLYYEQCGNPHGKPVVFLHGGPGAGCNAKSRRFFDPAHYRIVLFDQRGCGRSTPHAELTDNTTWHLVDDIETPAQASGHRALAGVRRLVGLDARARLRADAPRARERDSCCAASSCCAAGRWNGSTRTAATRSIPTRGRNTSSRFPAVERADLMGAYYRRLTSPDAAVQLEAAKAWSIWEGGTSFLAPSADYIASTGADEFALAFARIECHYFVHGGFFERDDQLLRDAHKLKNIPAVIVQGRYDVVCPMRSAWDLHRAWPEADLRIVGDAGPLGVRARHHARADQRDRSVSLIETRSVVATHKKKPGFDPVSR